MYHERLNLRKTSVSRRIRFDDAASAPNRRHGHGGRRRWGITGARRRHRQPLDGGDRRSGTVSRATAYRYFDSAGDVVWEVMSDRAVADIDEVMATGAMTSLPERWPPRMPSMATCSETPTVLAPSNAPRSTAASEAWPKTPTALLAAFATSTLRSNRSQISFRPRTAIVYATPSRSQWAPSSSGNARHVPTRHGQARSATRFGQTIAAGQPTGRGRLLRCRPLRNADPQDRATRSRTMGSSIRTVRRSLSPAEFLARCSRLQEPCSPDRVAPSTIQHRHDEGRHPVNESTTAQADRFHHEFSHRCAAPS